MALYDWSGMNIGKIKDFIEFEIMMLLSGIFLSRLEGVCYEVEPSVHYIMGYAWQRQDRMNLGAKSKAAATGFGSLLYGISAITFWVR